MVCLCKTLFLFASHNNRLCEVSNLQRKQKKMKEKIKYPNIVVLSGGSSNMHVVEPGVDG